MSPCTIPNPLVGNVTVTDRLCRAPSDTRVKSTSRLAGTSTALTGCDAVFEMTSVHYAATRFEAPECATDPVAVVGGGNSAGQVAIFLAQQTPRVYLLVRDADLGRDMSRYLCAP